MTKAPFKSIYTTMAMQLERSGGTPLEIAQRAEIEKLQGSLSKIGSRSLRWKTALGLGIACIAEGGASLVFGLAQQNEIATAAALGAGFLGTILPLAGQCDVIEARHAVRAELKDLQQPTN